ncbi:hypothetical protein EON79_06670 [bacterium]|nr:MAG: hypothetical protein EON79_06670 [bacterium]
MKIVEPFYSPSRLRFRLIWTFLGVSGVGLYLMAVSPRLADGSLGWQHHIFSALAAGGSVFLQSLWGRTWNLRLPSLEYAFLIAIGDLAQSGFTVVQEATPSYPGRWLLYVMGIAVAIAAPVRALRQAGVNPGQWWLWNVVGVVLGTLFWSFCDGALTGFGAPDSAYYSIPPTGGQFICVWFASRAVWTAVRQANPDDENNGLNGRPE